LTAASAAGLQFSAAEQGLYPSSVRCGSAVCSPAVRTSTRCEEVGASIIKAYDAAGALWPGCAAPGP